MNNWVFINLAACLFSSIYAMKVSNIAKKCNFPNLKSDNNKNKNCAVWEPEVGLQSQKEHMWKEITTAVSDVGADNRSLADV